MNGYLLICWSMCKNGSSLGENLLWLFVQKGIDSSLKKKKRKRKKK